MHDARRTVETGDRELARQARMRACAGRHHLEHDPGCRAALTSRSIWSRITAGPPPAGSARLVTKRRFLPLCYLSVGPTRDC